jgi:predicted dehydrogenase
MPSSSSSSRRPVRLAVVGTGGMANAHARHFKEIPGVSLTAACDIDRPRVEAYAAQHGVAAVYTDLAKLLREAPVDAVVVATPDAFHAPVTLACLKAGKHVLCEKPLALNYAEARRMVAAARKAGVINMVNLSYRGWPAIQGVAELVRRGVIGELRHVEASYLQAWLPSTIWGDWRTSPNWLWRLSTAHGSNGVLGDIGVHIVDFATYPAGGVGKVYCQLKAFPKAPGNRIGEYRLDANDSATLNVTFKNGALGVIHTTRWCGGHANRLYLKLAGTAGTVEIDGDRGIDIYRICAGKDLATCTWREVKAKPSPNNQARFIRAVRTGQVEQPDFARGAEVQKVLDAAFASAAADAPVRV